MKLPLNTATRQYVSIAVLAIIWGSSFILMKRGLEQFTATQVAEFRLFIAALFIVPVALLNFRKLPVQRKQRIGLVLVALFGNFLPAFLFATAQTKVPSGITGVLNSLVPMFTLIVGVVLFKSSIRKTQLSGVVLGLIGALLLVGFNQGLSGEVNWFYSGLIILAALCYAISVNTIKALLQDLPAILITAFSFSLILPVVTIDLLRQDFFVFAFQTQERIIGLGYLSILGLFGTTLALLLFNHLIKFTSAIFASSVTYLIPIVALLWGFIDGEVVQLTQILAFVLILMGVHLVNRQTNRF
jgi:drug/metabolite transporter (DMT)-like permease